LYQYAFGAEDRWRAPYLAAGKSEGEAKTVLEMLARWERTHEVLFKKLHDRAFEEYSQMPWGG